MRPYLLTLFTLAFIIECKAQSLEEPYYPLPIFEPANVCSDSPFSETWSYHGPSHEQQFPDNTPYLGMTTSLIMHPDSFGVIYASGNTSGLFKTLDEGEHWHNVTDDLGIPGMGITDIEYYPFDHSVIFATTGQTSNGYGNYSLGLIYSEDWGETWSYFSALSELISFHNPYIFGSTQCLAINPITEGEIFVGGHQRLYHTSNMGQTWTTVNFGELTPLDATDDEYMIADIVISPLDDDIVYVSTFSGTDGGGGSRVWISEDHGLTWENRTPQVPGDLGKRIRLDMRNADNVSLYASVLGGSSGTLVYFYKSIDHGITWELITGGLSLSGDGYWKGEFQVSDHDPNLMYYGAVLFYCIKFNGTSWVSIGANSKLHMDIRDIKLYTNAIGQEYILVASDGGVQLAELNVSQFLSGGSFPAWQSLNGQGLQLTQVYGHGDFERASGTVYGGQDIGTWKIEGSLSYNLQSYGDGRYSSTNSYFENLSVFGGYTNAEYINNGMSIGSPNSLSSYYTGPYGQSQAQNLRVKHYFNEKDQRQLLFPAKKIATFRLNEVTMQFPANPAGNDITDPAIPNPVPSVDTPFLTAKAYAFAPSDNNIRYVAYAGSYGSSVESVLSEANPAQVSNGELINRLLKSVDGGATYSIDLSNDLHYSSNGQTVYVYSWNHISYLMVDPRNANRVYAAISEFSEYPDRGRVIVSADGGNSWTDMSFGMGQFQVNQLLYQDGSDEVIYAGTDAGVYRWNKAESMWECFNNGLPPCIVTSMDINPCENSMTIATYGRGIWKAQLPPIENDVVFTTDYTIDQFEVHSYQNNIVVDAGATLTVKGHVYLKPEKSIIVKPGGHLIMDGALLSNSCRGVLAQGIIVEGNPEVDQSPVTDQGFCELKNETIIENMHNGVLCAGQYEDANGQMQTDYSKTGGIVYADNTTFLNCYVGAELLYYSAYSSLPQHWPLSNRSYFKECSFVTERALDMSPLGFVPAPKAGILLKEILKLKIEGCRFGNYSIGSDLFFDDPHKRGKGIWCLNSSCNVKDYCPSPPCTTTTHNIFENLEYGILSQSSNFVSTLEVRNAEFMANYCGIRSEGSLVGPVIRENNFYVEDLPENSDEFPVGINLDQTSGYHVQENHFTNSNHEEGNPLTIGIAIENTTLFGVDPVDIQEAATNVIYRNWFEGLDIGCNAEGQNAVEDPNNGGESYGLEFRCNKFGQNGTDCLKDFNLYGGTSVQKQQGNYDPNGAAGNLFYDDDCDIEYEHWDAGLGASELTAYYYNPNTSQFICEPNCSDATVTHPQQVFGAYSEANTCPVRNIDPSWKPKPVIKGEHAAKKIALLTTQDVFHQILDGGDINYLKELIDNPNTESAAIRNELLDFTPNITDVIWQKCFDRQPALNPWHLTQVLLSALPLRSSVLEMMKASTFPQEFKDMVYDGQFNGLSEKEIFESDLSSLAQDAGELRQDFLRYLFILDDDTNTDGNDDLEDFLLENASALDYYVLAGLRLMNKNIIGTNQALSNSSTVSPTKDIYRPMTIMIESIQASEYPNLNQDHINELEVYASDENYIGCAQARALLALTKEVVYPMEIDAEIVQERRAREIASKKSTIPFTIQPVPANDVVWLTYPYYPGMEKVSLSVVDITGREVMRKDLSQLNGIHELNTSNWVSGIYLVELFIDDLSLGVQKIEIQH